MTGLRQRIIAKILIDELGQAVKFKKFVSSHRVVGDPVSLCRTMKDQILDEFHFCFLGEADPELVREMNAACMTASSVAGSINTPELATKLIRECGVDKIVTKSDAVGKYVADNFGKQAACLAVDYVDDMAFMPVPDWAGEMLLTSMDRDGMMQGMDMAVLRFPWDVPVVLSGGCGKLEHVKQAFNEGANGVAIGSMFAFTSRTPVQLRSYLQTQGCNVRVA